MPTSSEVSQRVHHIRGITPKELEGLIAVLKLTEVVADQVGFRLQSLSLIIEFEGCGQVLFWK